MDFIFEIVYLIPRTAIRNQNGGLQLALRIDSAMNDEVDKELENLEYNGTQVPEYFSDHGEAGFALNYWFSPDFVLRVSYHYTNGGRFVYPDQEKIRTLLTDGKLEKVTHNVIFGVAFSF